MNLVCLKCGAQLNTGGNCIAGCPSPVIGTNCVWCGRGFPDGAPPLADHIAALEAELAERTRERDEAVGWIRVVGEECSSGGDRNTTLAKLRTDQRELAAERKRREAAEKDAELMWANCRIIYFPDPSGSYPLEHNMRACGTKDSRADIEAALRIDAARKERP